MKPTYLTHSLSASTPSYGNRDQVILEPNNQISKGDTANTTRVQITNNHIGTHVDVPKHFYENGKTLTDIDPKEWIFENVAIVDVICENPKLIEIDDIDTKNIDSETDFLIIRTGYESKRANKPYWASYPSLSPDMCSYLRDNYKNLRAIGFDFISLTSPLFKEEGKKAHKILLEEKDESFIFIVEDMKIAHLEDAPDKIIMMPLLIESGNGGPVTIIAY